MAFMFCFNKTVVFGRVQEIVNDDEQREAGRIPRTVDCEMTYDLG